MTKVLEHAAGIVLRDGTPARVVITAETWHDGYRLGFRVYPSTGSAMREATAFFLAVAGQLLQRFLEQDEKG